MKAPRIVRSELAVHMQVAAYLRRAMPQPDFPVLWWHTPNGEKRDQRTAAKLRAMGVLPGVADFLFIMPNGQAAFLELKSATGALSGDQEQFRFRVRQNGCGYATARTLDEAVVILERWLAAYGLQPRARLTRRIAA